MLAHKQDRMDGWSFFYGKAVEAFLLLGYWEDSGRCGGAVNRSATSITTEPGYLSRAILHHVGHVQASPSSPDKPISTWQAVVGSEATSVPFAAGSQEGGDNPHAKQT